MAGDDDLELRATMDDAVSSVLARIEARLEATERRREDVDAAGRRAGEGVQDGAEKGEDALKREGDQADRTSTQLDRTREETRKLGDESTRTSKKADKSASAWERWEKRLAKTSKTFGRFSWLMKTFKITAVVGALFAAAGAVSALGAAAVMAVGGIGAMLPGLVALGPIGLSAALGMKAFKLAAEEMEPQLNAIKGQFDDLGQSVAQGGLADGLDYLSDHMGDFAAEVDQGFGWIGGSLGRGSIALGDFLSQTQRLDQTERIFWSLSNIIDILVPGLLGFGGGLMSVITAALPAGERLAEVLAGVGISFDQWATKMLDSGRATEYINNSLDLLLRGMGVLTDFVVGLYRVFSIAADESDSMGFSIEAAAEKFKAWTGSVEGQASIAQYFRDAMPAIKETALLIGDLLKMFGGLAADQNVAPLLAQLRTEFVPALGELLTKMSGADGLLPVLVSAATAVADLLTVLDPSALQFLVDGFAALVEAVALVAETVPGADSALSTLFAGLLLVGPIAGVASAVSGVVDSVTGLGDTIQTVKDGYATGMEYFDQFTGVKEELTAMKDEVMGAVEWTKGLVAEGSYLHGPFEKAKGAASRFGTVLKTQVAAGMAWVRTTATTMWAAVLGPIGWIILAIIAVIAIVWLLWTHCEWFRDAVTAVWEWIKNAALAAWVWIKQATAITIAVIGAIFMWLWTNIIKPVIDFIVGYWTVVWNIIVFVVQVVVFIIVGIIVVLATIAAEIWNGIATAAVWVWQSIILPVIQFVVWLVITIFTALVAFFAWVWGIIVQQASFAWNGVIVPLFQAVAGFAMAIWAPVAAFFAWLWGIIQQGASFAWNGVIMPLFGFVAGIAMAVWSPIAAFFSGLWNGISAAGRAAFDGISNAARMVAGVVRGAWDAVVGAVRGAYNAIARGWNSIPSITVPAWVPGIGGSTFGLPKLPTLWHGGRIDQGSAIVGEHGPEPLLGPGGRYMGMLGAGGPEIASGLPRGGYVVPNLDTLTRMPGLLKSLPSGVGSAVARSVPGYADLLRPSATVVAPPPGRDSGGSERELVGAVRGLTRAVLDRPPPISANGADTEAQVLRALRRHEREKELRERYSY